MNDDFKNSTKILLEGEVIKAFQPGQSESPISPSEVLDKLGGNVFEPIDSGAQNPSQGDEKNSGSED